LLSIAGREIKPWRAMDAVICLVFLRDFSSLENVEKAPFCWLLRLPWLVTRRPITGIRVKKVHSSSPSEYREWKVINTGMQFQSRNLGKMTVGATLAGVIS
jgi:hypothetical protein